MLGSVEAETATPDMCEPEEQVQGEFMSEVYDDSSGEALDKRLVQETCEEDMQSFRDMGVYEYVLRTNAHQDPNGRVVGVRWVKINKGTRLRP